MHERAAPGATAFYWSAGSLPSLWRGRSGPPLRMRRDPSYPPAYPLPPNFLDWVMAARTASVLRQRRRIPGHPSLRPPPRAALLEKCRARPSPPLVVPWPLWTCLTDKLVIDIFLFGVTEAHARTDCGPIPTPPSLYKYQDCRPQPRHQVPSSANISTFTRPKASTLENTVDKMISTRELPNHADLKPYNHAVAGQ